MCEIICRRFLVTGQVQGVFFREGTARQARDLAISGHAVNLPDGRVEVLACGGRENISTLSDWLREGTPAARVDNVSCEAVDQAAEAPHGFRTG
jgi:acylphosphatase